MMVVDGNAGNALNPMSAIGDISSLIVVESQTKKKLVEILDIVRTTLDVEQGFLAVAEQDSIDPDLLLSFGVGDGMEVESVLPLDIMKGWDAADIGGIFSEPNTAFSQRLFTVPGIAGPVTAIAAPIQRRSQDVVVGVLAVYTKAERAPLAEIQNFLTTIAGLVSLLLENRSAYRDRLRSQRLIQAAKQEWERTVDLLPQLILVVNREGNILRSNLTLQRWLSIDVKDAKGRFYHDLLHPDCDQPDCELKQRFDVEWLKVLTGRDVTWEYLDTSMERYLKVYIRLLHNDTGSESIGDDGYATVVLEDITNRKAAEEIRGIYERKLEAKVEEATRLLNETNRNLELQLREQIRDKAALRESESRYASLVNITQTGIYIAEEDHVVFCNQRFADILGIRVADVLGKPLSSLLDTSYLSEMGDGVAPSGIMRNPTLVRGGSRSSRELWLSQSTAPIYYQGKSALLGNVVDSTPLVRVQKDLEESKRELESLYRQYLSVQENERHRIASDLHDGIGQTLSGIKFGLENTIDDIEKRLGQPSDRLRGVLQKLQIGIDEVRRTAMNLRPATLDHLGIIATIKWFCREFQQDRPDIVVDRQIDLVEADFPENLKVVMFRIIQEGFNNVAKHAQANTITLSIYNGDSGVVLLICDDGIGMTRNPNSSRVGGGGLGLVGMRERAEHSGGMLVIDSRPGRGTKLKVTWPTDGFRGTKLDFDLELGETPNQSNLG